MIRTNANKALNTTARKAADRLRLSRADTKTNKDWSSGTPFKGAGGSIQIGYAERPREAANGRNSRTTAW